MKLDQKFTEKLQTWLNTPDDEKDYAEGAMMLLQLTGNQIMYRNISFNPKGKAEFIIGKLQQYLKFRLAELTHEQVKQMQKKVDEIAKVTIKTDGDFADFKAGKRADHDKLPEEIQALYVENLDIIHKMRELHLQLRKLSTANTTCPDSERYPFLKELISLDKRLHENWDTYDHYVCPANNNTAADPKNASQSDTVRSDSVAAKTKGAAKSKPRKR